ncbi:MAG: hypothetical protein JXB34_03810 [Bacteroidales bacterium]|nr:hypothetical protein [Bacteroidales bacterium]
MEQNILKLGLINGLTEDSRKEICWQNKILKENAGAVFEIDEVTKNSVQVSVKNLNGKRWGKYDLLVQAYQVFSVNLPSGYRLLIRL